MLIITLNFNGGSYLKYDANHLWYRSKKFVKGHYKLSMLTTDKSLKNYVWKSKCISKRLLNFTCSFNNNQESEETAENNWWEARSRKGECMAT